jgi:stearoyl-CoA desaturase (delta-9 desaturase)
MTTHTSHFYKIIIPQHLAGLVAIGLLFAGESTVWLLATFAAWFLCFVMGEGIFFHKYFSHRSFETNPIIAKIFAVFGLLGGFGSPISYRAVHTGLHHAHSDTDKDSHSPIHGFWHSWLLWHLTSVRPPLIICKTLLKDKFYVWLEANIIKIWWTTVILLALVDWRLPIFTMGLAGMIGMSMAGISNSIGHSYGSRRFDTNDNSRNVWWISWFTWQGGILQNNHHARPSRYHDSLAWYEFDIGKWIIPLIATKIHYQE